MTTANTPKLLLIGTRVTHYSGEAGTHGKGIIIAYNGIEPSSYLESNFKDAVEMAGEAQLLGGLVSSMYDKTRYPYVVRFDPRKPDSDHDKEMLRKYPQGYKDVYGPDCVQLLKSEPNIFPHPNAAIMIRAWDAVNAQWCNWCTTTHGLYLKYKDCNDIFEFCVRNTPDTEFVEIDDVKKPKQSATPPSDEVFVTPPPGEESTYFSNVVRKWKGIVNDADFSLAMLYYKKEIS